MERPDEEAAAGPEETRLLLALRAGLGSRRGRLLLVQAALSFVIFLCYIASAAAAFLVVPLLTLLLALGFFMAYSLKLDEKFKGIYWNLADFLSSIIAAIIYFAISIAAVSKYSDTASKASGVFGFVATVVYCVYAYFAFNSLAAFLKEGNSSDAPKQRKPENDSDSDSD